eukprot:jgi/Bigna1/86286/estExt_fgenesh1_pg.C_90200
MMLRKPALVQLLDHKRTRNVLIALSGLKFSLEELVGRLSRMNVRSLSSDTIDRVVAIFPTEEELEMVKSYGGSVAALGKAERFLYELGKDAHIRSKISWIQFIKGFDTARSGVSRSLDTVKRAIESLLNSQGIKQFLMVALRYGNTMNLGSKRYDNAYGFTLSSLLSLRHIKAAGRSKNLLLHLLRQVEGYGTSAVSIMDDLKMVEAASRIDMTYIRAEIVRIKRTIDDISLFLEGGANTSSFSSCSPSVSSASDGKNNDFLVRFCKEAKEGYEVLLKHGVEVDTLEKMLFRRFILDTKKATLEEHLQFWSTFLLQHLRPALSQS